MIQSIMLICLVFQNRFSPSQFTVKLGEWDLKDADNYSQEFRVVQISAHPDFKPNGFYNDVAVFKIDQPVNFNEYVELIHMQSITYFHYANYIIIKN